MNNKQRHFFRIYTLKVFKSFPELQDTWENQVMCCECWPINQPSPIMMSLGGLNKGMVDSFFLDKSAVFFVGKRNLVKSFVNIVRDPLDGMDDYLEI